MQTISSEEKAMWVEDWRGSGKSAWAYAQENGLNQRTFVKWTKAAVAAKPCFVEVAAPVIAPAAHTPEILIERGDVKIHIPLCAGNAGLRAVMESLVAAL
jgi:hypothetical protein